MPVVDRFLAGLDVVRFNTVIVNAQAGLASGSDSKNRYVTGPWRRATRTAAGPSAGVGTKRR